MGIFRSQMWTVLEWKDDSTDTLVYRFPMDGKEIMSGSQLTVRESQMAVFVHLGEIADVFGPGKYKLTTKNLPILSGIGSIWYKGESRFKAELYFVNTKQFLDRKWGTQSPVAMRDAEFGMIRIRAYGNYAFRVKNGVQFMKEVFGTRGLVKLSEIEGALQNMLISQMSDAIAESQITALDMAQNYTEFGELILSRAQAKFADWGLALTEFNVININFPEAVEKAIDERSSLGILGSHMGLYAQKKAADALGDAAKNQGATGTVVGMGMGAMMNGFMAGAAAAPAPQQPQPQQQQQQQQPQPKKASGGAKFCSECGSPVKEGAKFCSECGNKLQ